ncbi:MAG: vitamin K epoxide reductase family protein [SAR324 cluster bacterium]|nr:vitamin K epoxide reductase family protein [SAR324 cluster bacterium]
MAKKKSAKAARRAAKRAAARATEAAETTESAAEKTAPRDKKKRPTGRPQRERRRVPNWPVLILAVAGMALAGFLTVSTWVEAALPYCAEGSDCDIVQSSRWSTALGLPVAFWGFAAYGALAWIAYRVKALETHWKLSWTIALVGLAVSVYLNVISITVLEATCAYCLASLGIMAAIFAVVAFQSPRGLAEFAWPSWLLQTGGVAAALIVGMHLYFSGAFDPSLGDEDPYLRALAIHLNDIDAKFYGAFWCPNCDRQKREFRASASRLPYIECSPGGRNAPQAPVCGINGVTVYPTWVIDGRKYEGYLSADTLVLHSGFSAEAAGVSRSGND